MPHFLPIGFAAGLVTALLFASASVGGMSGRVILFFLAPLPSYLAGIGWGWMAAAIAAVASAVTAGAFMGLRTSIVFFLSQGLPLVVLCYLVALNRVVAPATQGAAPGPADLEWYPIGRIVAAATLMAGGLAFLSILLLGADLDSLRAMMRELVDTVLLKQMPSLGGGDIGEVEKTALANLMLHALPAASAVLWLGGFLLNLWLGAKVTLISGRLMRPWPDLAALKLPRGFGVLLLASLGATLLPELPGLMATGVAGALLFAYLLTGLAILHYATRGLPARPFVLWGTYLALLLFNTWAGLLIALVAVLEPLMWYRRPDGPQPSSPPGPPPRT